MSYSRITLSQIQRRLKEPSPLIQVVVGPRQIGKTTAIRQALQGRGLYETADSPSPLSPQVIEVWWKQTLALAEPILAIDEVQKIPGWSEVVKKLWDRRPPGFKLLLSGSAALSIEKDLKESLAGRFELIRAEHWNFSEAREVFGVDFRRFTELGCYPGSMAFSGDLERWGAYVRDSIVEPAIGRDLLQLHPVKSPALLRHLFGVCASLPAQVVSLNKLQGQLQDKGAIATLQHYLDLLSQGFLVTGIQKYSEAGFRARKSAPKIVVHDNALIRCFERPVTAPLGPEKFGRYFENAVAARFVEAGWDTYYWNDRAQDVDLVVLGPEGEKLAIEVKSSRSSADELSGLRLFARRHPSFEPCLVSLEGESFPGVRSLSVEGVLGLSRGRKTLG